MATVKKKRIRGQPETLEELRVRITEACNSITVRHLREEIFKIAWDIV
jgi:hypothetical protein